MFKKLIPAALAAAILSGCASTMNTSPIPAELAKADLAGHSFMWTEGASEDCELPPSISFSAEGRVSGMAGCNRLIGSWTQDGQKIDLGQLGTTMRLCAPEFMKVERKFLDLLAQTRYATQAEDGKSIDLWNEKGEKVVTLAPERAGKCD